MTHSIRLHFPNAWKQLAKSIINESVTELNCLDDTFRRKLSMLAEYNQLLLVLAKNEEFYLPDDHYILDRVKRLLLLEYETMGVVCNLLPQFEENRLPLMAIKSFLPFPYVDTNLDFVAVHQGKWKQYVKKLSRLGYSQFRNLADLREPGKPTFYRPDIALRIHLHRDITWNGLVYLPLDQVWERKRNIIFNTHSVAIPSAEDELLIMAAHACFENKYVSLHEVLYWYYLVRMDLDWDYMVKTAVGMNWFFGFRLFNSVISKLADAIEIGVDVPLKLFQLPHKERFIFPYILSPKHTFAIASSKLKRDIIDKKWRQMLREFFSYTLVDGLWMYHKAYRKKQKVVQICS